MAVAEWRSRINLPRVETRTVAGVTLAAAAALLVLLITRPAPTTPVLVAASDIPAGAPLAGLPIDVRRVSDPAGLVVGDSLGELGEWTLAVPLAGGEPLVASLLRAPEQTVAPDLLSIELPTARAVLGRVFPGDHIDLHVTVRQQDGSMLSQPVADNVLVVDAASAGGSLAAPAIGLVLAVDDALAAAITEATASGDLHVVKVGP